MAGPNFRPWTKKHFAQLAVLCVVAGIAWWFVPWISWFNEFFAPVLPSRSLVWKVRDRGLHGRGFVVSSSPDASIYVVGDTQGPGSGPYPVSYDAPFIARYSASGERVWKRVFTEDRGSDQSVLHDVTMMSDGQICALSHHYRTFDNGRVRCFDPSGDATVDYVLKIPRSTRLLTLPNDSLALGGSEVRSWSGGLALSAAWLAELRGGELRWSGTQRGKLGGNSEVHALALAPGGDIVTGGSIGRGHAVAQPWVARWSAAGKLLWSNVMPCYAWKDQTVTDVGVTESGAILAAGFCDYPWVRRYSEHGSLRWEHRFAPRDFPSSLYTTEGGFVVGSRDTFDDWGRRGRAWNIRGLSSAGFPRWVIRRDGCTALTRIRPAASGSVIALGTCANSMVLAKFAPAD